MDKAKRFNSPETARSLKYHRNRNVVVGSFITEALSPHLPQYFEENESMDDDCLGFTVFTSNSDVISQPADNLFSGVTTINTHQLFSTANIDHQELKSITIENGDADNELNLHTDTLPMNVHMSSNQMGVTDVLNTPKSIAKKGCHATSPASDEGNGPFNILPSPNRFLWKRPASVLDLDNSVETTNGVEFESNEEATAFIINPKKKFRQSKVISECEGSGTDETPKRPRLELSSSTDVVAVAGNQVGAFIRMPVDDGGAQSITSVNTAADSLTFLNNIISSDQVIEIVDGDVRMFHIPLASAAVPVSHTLESSVPSTALEHSTSTLTEVTAAPSSSQQVQMTTGINLDGEGHSSGSPVLIQSASITQSSVTKKTTAGGDTTGKRKGGWPKGKKRKPEKFKINQPKSAYLIFAKKRRRELINTNPKWTFSEITVMMGKEWTGLDAHLKEEFRKLAEEDQKRFREELQGYVQTDDYQNILKRKRDEASAKWGVTEEEDLGYVEEDFTLFCHICNQRFRTMHNRREHLAGRFHLNNLQAELRKATLPPGSIAEVRESSGGQADPPCCEHCINRVVEGVDASLDINSQMEAFLHKQSVRERELDMLTSNSISQKEANSQLSKELISLQERVVKLKQEIQADKQWQLQLSKRIDNLKMVPTIFGVFNF